MRTLVHNVGKVHNTIREGGIRTAMRTVVHYVGKVHKTIQDGGIRIAILCSLLPRQIWISGTPGSDCLSSL